MSRVCPECGREYFGKTVKCIHCNIPLVEKSGSQSTQQTIGKTKQQTRQTAAQTNYQRVKQAREEQEKARQQQQLLLLEQEQKREKKGKETNSTLGILALVFSILGCTFWIGIVLAIIDLCRKDGKKKNLSIISMVICALWIGISVGASRIPDSKRDKVEPQNVKVESDDLYDSAEIYNSTNKEEEESDKYTESEVKTNETIQIKEETDAYGSENIDLSEELSNFSSGEYLFITNDDLDKYHANMVGVKVYVVTDIDDMTPNKIQSTLSGGYMMSNFDVGERYPKYETAMKKGDMVAIMGTVTGRDDFGFMGTSVSLNGCRIFAVGDSALSYLKNASDSGLSEYFFTTGEVEGETESYNNNNISETEYKSLCNSLDYEDIMRNPDSNKDRYCTVSGTVDQIIEGWFGSFSIFIVDYSGNKWGCTYTYKDGESRLMEGDNVTVYGKCKGTDTTTTVLGQQVTMPRVDIEYIY